MKSQSAPQKPAKAYVAPKLAQAAKLAEVTGQPAIVVSGSRLPA